MLSRPVVSSAIVLQFFLVVNEQCRGESECVYVSSVATSASKVTITCSSHHP